MTISSENREKVAKFLQHYGDFFAFWSTFDLIIEIMIMRKLGIDEEETCIVCAGLGFGMKVAILKSLMNRHPDSAAHVADIEKAQNLAARNSFAHGFFMLNRSTAEFKLIRRAVKDHYTATTKHYNDATMEKHTKDFIAHVNEMMKTFLITEDEIEDYIKRIEAYALAQVAEDKHHPSPPTSSKKATKK